MKRMNQVTVVFLAVVIAGVIALLVLEASRGPTFRAEDHATYQECIRNIPLEWAPGSLERQGAETSCLFIHERRLREGR